MMNKSFLHSLKKKLFSGQLKTQVKEDSFEDYVAEFVEYKTSILKLKRFIDSQYTTISAIISNNQSIWSTMSSIFSDSEYPCRHQIDKVLEVYTIDPLPSTILSDISQCQERIEAIVEQMNIVDKMIGIREDYIKEYTYYHSKYTKLTERANIQQLKGKQLNKKDQEKLLRNKEKLRSVKLSLEQVDENTCDVLDQFLFIRYDMLLPIITQLFEISKDMTNYHQLYLKEFTPSPSHHQQQQKQANSIAASPVKTTQMVNLGGNDTQQASTPTTTVSNSTTSSGSSSLSPTVNPASIANVTSVGSVDPKVIDLSIEQKKTGESNIPTKTAGNGDDDNDDDDDDDDLFKSPTEAPMAYDFDVPNRSDDNAQSNHKDGIATTDTNTSSTDEGKLNTTDNPNPQQDKPLGEFQLDNLPLLMAQSPTGITHQNQLFISFSRQPTRPPVSTTTTSDLDGEQVLDPSIAITSQEESCAATTTAVSPGALLTHHRRSSTASSKGGRLRRSNLVSSLDSPSHIGRSLPHNRNNMSQSNNSLSSDSFNVTKSSSSPHMSTTHTTTDITNEQAYVKKIGYSSIQSSDGGTTITGGRTSTTSADVISEGSDTDEHSYDDDDDPYNSQDLAYHKTYLEIKQHLARQQLERQKVSSTTNQSTTTNGSSTTQPSNNETTIVLVKTTHGKPTARNPRSQKRHSQPPRDDNNPFQHTGPITSNSTANSSVAPSDSAIIGGDDAYSRTSQISTTSSSTSSSLHQNMTAIVPDKANVRRPPPLQRTSSQEMANLSRQSSSLSSSSTAEHYSSVNDLLSPAPSCFTFDSPPSSLSSAGSTTDASTAQPLQQPHEQLNKNTSGPKVPPRRPQSTLGDNNTTPVTPPLDHPTNNNRPTGQPQQQTTNPPVTIIGSSSQLQLNHRRGSSSSSSSSHAAPAGTNTSLPQKQQADTKIYL